ncbi:MAG: glycoside hydrolase family 127 protein, partial [Pirellulaceae bacterium]|nr:glycoside hydrolase family 127 protein [Pirellulaceae bacterium]
WDGTVTVGVEPETPGKFDLCLRIPSWAQGRPLPSDLYRFADPASVDWTVTVNGQAVDSRELDKGYVRIERNWRGGDVVRLHLPMPVRRIYAHENVKYDRGRVALMRGPVVYCLEGVDHGPSVLSIVLPNESKITSEHRADLLGGVTVLRGKGLADDRQSVEFTAVPYYAWQNRGIDEMTVWLIEGPQ